LGFLVLAFDGGGFFGGGFLLSRQLVDALLDLVLRGRFVFAGLVFVLGAFARRFLVIFGGLLGLLCGFLGCLVL
jgi:hypothetical protein